MPQIERIPPHNEDAERSVLGAVLLDAEVFFKVSEFIKAEDFYNPSNKEIFTAMTELHQADCPIDAVTVTERLQKRKSLEACGGRSYIAELSAEVPTTANAAQYAQIIQEKSTYRKLIKAGSDIVENSINEKMDSNQALDRAESSIFDISKARQTRDYVTIQSVLARNLEQIETASKNGGALPGLSTGFRDLDYATSGLQNSDLIILAARPSMGKTAFAMNIAHNVALKQKKRVAFFSVEMSELPVGQRFLAMQSRVDSKKLQRGDLSDEDWESVHEAIDRFQDAELIIDATPGISVMEVRNKCRRMNAEKKLDLIIIDYLQIMSSDGRSENRVNEVSMMTRYLKQLAREMECPLIVLSQVSRSTVKRDESNKRPQLSDLRDSGSIEQDADVVMFIHREDYYRKDDTPKDNIAEIIIAKQRQGETGTVKLTWMPRFQKFADLQKEDAFSNMPEGAM